MKIISKEKKKQIRSLLKKHPPYSYRTIAKEVGDVSHVTIKNYAKEWGLTSR
jgi:hypothetical protein